VAANVAALDKISFEQQVDDKALALLNSCPMDQTVGIDGVRCLLDCFEIDMRAGLFSGGYNRGLCFDRAFFSAELSFKVSASIHPFRWHVGVQLKRMPFDDKGVIGELL